MTYREYMEAHEHENFSWCKPYFDESEDYFILMVDSSVEHVITPDFDVSRCCDGDRAIEEALHIVVKAINPEYDSYSGWSDLHIALEVMHEVGCAHCPFKDDCECMGEEIDDIDFR